MRAIFILALSASLSACVALDHETKNTSTAKKETLTKVSYVAYHTLDSTKPLIVAAVLRTPPVVSGPMPAVVIVHGSSGVDSRGSSYAAELNAVGIATLEIDMWSARNINSPADRPKGVPLTLPDAYGAFKFLATDPTIDAKRIGIMGFSWGGVVSMLTATKPYTEQYLGKEMKFAAHAPNYPVCWVYNRAPGYEFKEFTGAPILLQAGEGDTYDKPDTCANLVTSLGERGASLITLKMYPNAGHGWDRTEPAITINDPYAHLGRGGPVVMAENAGVAAQSRAATVAFFRCKLVLANCN
jgi:dienelactone hydrolase